MDGLMPLKSRVAGKTFAAHGAKVRSVAAVNPLVTDEGRLEGKTFAALGAGVRLLPRVNPNVPSQLRMAAEALAAVWASVEDVALVDDLVVQGQA